MCGKTEWLVIISSSIIEDTVTCSWSPSTFLFKIWCIVESFSPSSTQLIYDISDCIISGNFSALYFEWHTHTETLSPIHTLLFRCWLRWQLKPLPNRLAVEHHSGPVTWFCLLVNSSLISLRTVRDVGLFSTYENTCWNHLGQMRGNILFTWTYFLCRVIAQLCWEILLSIRVIGNKNSSKENVKLKVKVSF